MSPEVTISQLRYGVHELLHIREERLNSLRALHESTLQELYITLSRKRSHGSTFPDIDLDYDGNLGSVESFASFEEWKTSFHLQPGPSRIAKLELPDLPPPSPPPGVTVFPDEPPLQTSLPGPSRTTMSVEIPLKRKTSSRQQSPQDSGPLSSPGAGPSRPYRSRSSMNTANGTVSMAEIRPRRIHSPTIAEVPPDWIPINNYNVAESPSTPPQIVMPLESDYTSTLPPLPPLPTTSARRHKRALKNEDRIDLYKSQIQYQLNPLSDHLYKSNKVVLTNDWKVAMNEMRLIRAMELIDAKKEAGRWSLRQPKKLRASPVPKAHWDYMLEEMEWMQNDFAEERRWKMVLAQEFAYQVVEWHLAKPHIKAQLMVGGRGWGSCNNVPIPGHVSRDHDANQNEVEMDEQDGAEEDVEMLVGQEQDEEVRQDDAAETSAEVLEDILPRRGRRRQKNDVEEKDMEAEAFADKTNIEQVSTPIKREPEEPQEPRRAQDDAMDMDADGEADAEGEADADGEADAEGEADADAEGEVDVTDEAVGLSDIPPRTAITDADGLQDDLAQNDTGPQHVNTIHKLFSSREELYAARQPLLNATLSTAVMNIDDMSIGLSKSIKSEDIESPAIHLDDLFPELNMYTGPIPPEEGKVHKRLDEGHTSPHRVAHTSRIMDLQPILVSALQPAKNTAFGDWDLHEGLWYEDPKGSADLPAEVIATATSIFHGKTYSPPHPSLRPPMPEPAAHKLRQPFVWTEEEDQMLKELVGLYPFNWPLITDCFNTEMVTIPTEIRNPYECWERWHFTFGPGKGTVPEVAPTSSSAAAASTSAQASQGQSTSATGPTVSTPGNVPPSVAPSSATTPAPGTATTVPPPTAGSRPAPPQSATGPAGPSQPSAIPSSNPADGEAPPPPGLSKREAKAAARNKYEGTKKSIRHQVIYDSVRRLVRRREAAKLKHTKDPGKRVITVHESHSSYHMAQISTPWELVEAKYQRDMRMAQQRQERILAEQQHRAAQQRQQQQMMNAPPQQGRPPAPPGPVPIPVPIQPGQGGPSQLQGQMPPGPPAGPQGQNQGPPLRPNQPVPNMAASQQQLLQAVAAASAVNRQNGQSPVPGNVRPPQNVLPQQQQQLPPGQQPPNMAQMQQILQAQNLAAQQAQIQAQARMQQSQSQGQGSVQGQSQNRVPSGGTPHLQSTNLSASPYSHSQGELPIPNGDGNGNHSSPAMQSAQMVGSSPSQQAAVLAQQAAVMGRASSIPINQQHLRVSSGNGPRQGSPQISDNGNPNASANNQQGGMSPTVMQNIVAQIVASGQQPTPDVIRAFSAQLMRNAAQMSQAQAQAQAPTMGTPPQIHVQPNPPQQGTPQMQNLQTPQNQGQSQSQAQGNVSPSS